MTELMENEPLPPKNNDEEISTEIYTPLIEEVNESKINDINIDITTTITLYDFEIKSILIVPSTSATITITIRTSHLPQDRTIFLQGQSYFDWSSCDSYIYDYIRENIKSIY